MSGDRTIKMGTGDYNEQSGSFGIGINKGTANIENLHVGTNEPQSQSLAQAAAEVQQLLQQLQQTNSGNSTSAQMMVAAQAIQQIEGSPTLKQKVISAVKEGGLAAFERALDNPAGAFVAGAIRGWQEVEAE